MSVVALSDLIFGDLLTETNMKPYWEKLRGYVLGASMAFALSATYLTLNGISLNCVPLTTLNGSCVMEYSLLQASWTNTYCSNRLPWYINLFGPIALLASLCILAASSYWLYFPQVIDSFVTFVDLEKIITSVNEPLPKLQKMPLETKEKKVDQSKLREVCNELWKGGKNTKLPQTYCIRNWVLIAFASVLGSAFAVIAGFMIAEGDQFQCKLASNDSTLENITQIFPAQYLCASPSAYRHIALAILYALSILIQAIPVFIGMWKWKSYKRFCGSFKNTDFLRFFWKNARPTRSKTLSQFIQHVCGEDAIEDMKKSLPKAIVSEDYELVNNFLSLAEGGGSTLLKEMKNILESDVINDEILLEISKRIPASTPAGDYKKLLVLASTKERWDLLAGILNEVVVKRGVPDGYNLLSNLDINFDLLDETGCSVLFYFKDRPLLYPIVALLNEDCTSLGFRLCVHREGKSFLVSKEMKLTGLDRTAVSFNKSQLMIAEWLADFKEGANVPYNLLEKLERVKFQKWSEDAKKLLKSLKDKDMSSVVFLLNAFVVTEDEREHVSKLDCGVESFDDTIVTHFIFRVHGNHYVPTAARHILKCSKECRNLAKTLLSKRDHDGLLNFIAKCNTENENS